MKFNFLLYSHCFYLLAVLKEGASASVLPAEGTGCTNLAEQGLLQCLAHAQLSHVAVAERGKGARLSRSVGTDMEESAP